MDTVRFLANQSPSKLLEYFLDSEKTIVLFEATKGDLAQLYYCSGELALEIGKRPGGQEMLIQNIELIGSVQLAAVLDALLILKNFAVQSVAQKNVTSQVDVLRAASMEYLISWNIFHITKLLNNGHEDPSSVVRTRSLSASFKTLREALKVLDTRLANLSIDSSDNVRSVPDDEQDFFCFEDFPFAGLWLKRIMSRKGSVEKGQDTILDRF